MERHVTTLQLSLMACQVLMGYRQLSPMTRRVLMEHQEHHQLTDAAKRHQHVGTANTTDKVSQTRDARTHANQAQFRPVHDSVHWTATLCI